MQERELRHLIEDVRQGRLPRRGFIQRMVMLGHAWVMRMYYDHLPPDRQQKLNKLEAWAKSKNVGLWSAPNPTPPWQWRKETQRPTAC